MQPTHQPARAALSGLFLLTLITVAFVTTTAHAASPCGATTTVKRGDTLSTIAERCDISERLILEANPAVEGSDDLRVGSTVKTGDSAPGDDAEGRLRSFARGVGDKLSGLARDIGSSAQEILDKNPDLQRRLRRVGETLHIPGVDSGKVDIGISPQSGASGSAVTVTAVGLPANVPVAIGAGFPRRSYELLDKARTTADGTLEATVQVPDWADPDKPLIFVVAGVDQEWTARAPAFDVAPRAGRP